MKHLKHQNGVVLLIAMMALLAGSAAYLAGVHHSRSSNTKTLQSLLAAKQSLIAYAVLYADNYGHNTRGGTGRLPCPSLTRSGSPARSCSRNAIGYLPSAWLRDGSLMEIDYLDRFLDQNFWYAVSADHRFNPSFNTLNSDPGDDLLTVESMNEVVAVLIAPGTPTENQSRDGSMHLPAPDVVFEYLEGENADGDSEYTLTAANDLLVSIRRSELVPLMERRVLGYVKQWLIEYKNNHGYYPYAASPGGAGDCEEGLARGMLAVESGTCGEASLADLTYSDLPRNRILRQTWFYRYRWPEFIYYVVDETCLPPNGFSDCDGIDDPQRALRVDDRPVEVLLISVGEPIETSMGIQMRDELVLANYFDTEELLSAVDVFRTPSLSAYSNDQLVVID